MITVNESFHTKANGQVIHPVPKLSVSFSKTVGNGGWFTLNSSKLNSDDLLATANNNPFQIWDRFNYTDYTDRLISVDVERSVEFPYGTQAAMADFTLDNYDNYFTPGFGSAIDEDNLPGRPCRVYGGFNGEGVVSQFVGLTQKMPSIDEENATATYHADDFLTEIAKQTLNKIVVMRNARTDQVLTKIVQQFGLTPGQYSFEKGVNVIPFVFFNEGQNAGEAIQQLVQAEGGKFWLDEMGILRFSHRQKGPEIPTRTLNEYSVVSSTPKGYSNIVNHVVISCDLREVQEFQTVYTKTPSGDSANMNWVVGANSSITRSVKLEDPCYSIVTPTLGHASSVSWFTAIKSDMSNVSSGITVTGSMSTNEYTMTFNNMNNFAVEINEMCLWGEPAKVYDHLDYDSYEDVSVRKFGEHRMTIADNPFFQSYEQALEYSDAILNERAFFNSAYEMELKGDFSFQIGDTFDLIRKNSFLFPDGTSGKVNDNDLSGSRTSAGGSVTTQFQSFEFTLKPNTAYTISFNMNKGGTLSNAQTGRVRLYLDNAWTNTWSTNSTTTRNSLTFTSGATGIVRFGFYYYYSETNAGTAWVDWTDVQLEEGSAATTFQPYQDGTYEIDGITWSMKNGYLSTTYQVHSVPHHEYFILDQSILDDIYVLA